MKTKCYVIVGAGQAGCNAAKALRTGDPESKIILIGEEPYVPYERPHLSKGFLSGTVELDQLLVVKADYFDANKISLLKSSMVVSIDQNMKEVKLSNGECLLYDKLLLTTGSKPRQLKIPGSKLKGIHYLRTLDQAKALHDHLAVASHLVIIGGGFIGLEIASIARQYKKCVVTVVEAGNMILQRGVTKEMREHIHQLHLLHGVNFLFNKSITTFLGDDQVASVEFQNKEILEADCVVIGIGVEPRTELAQDAGLAIQNGIVVNEYCETSTVDIFAAGDVTSQWNAQLDQFIRLESWQTAQMQSVCAAQNMLGIATKYNQVPWFWTDQYGVNIQLVGVISSGEKLVYRRFKDNNFIYFYFNNQKLCGAFGFNTGKYIRATQKLLEQGISPDPILLANPEQDLKKLLKPKKKK
jgi:3-phenylpropionate/trans-cinnamate dioxygenase ferredoxin reductase component